MNDKQSKYCRQISVAPKMSRIEFIDERGESIGESHFEKMSKADILKRIINISKIISDLTKELQNREINQELKSQKQTMPAKRTEVKPQRLYWDQDDSNDFLDDEEDSK